MSLSLRQVLTVLVGERVQPDLKAARGHALDFIQPVLFLKPPILEELACPVDVFVVELDPYVPREPVAIGIGVGEVDELGLTIWRVRLVIGGR